MHFWSTLNHRYSLTMVEIEKKYFPGTNLTIGLSKYVKIKALSSLPFLFGLFLVGNRESLHVQGSELKFNIVLFTRTIPGQLNVKTFWFLNIPVCGYRWQRIFQKKFNPLFRVRLLFSVSRPKIGFRNI